MTDDIAKALAYQVKREIAENYFGTRKVIEEDVRALDDMVAGISMFYERKIGPDLLRVYALLIEPARIDRFLKLVGWPKRPLYEDYVVESDGIRKRLLQRIEERGWTAFSRFWNRLVDSYEKLHRDAEAFADMVEEAREQAELVNHEIRRFNEKFSLDDILSFVKSLDRHNERRAVLGDHLPGGEKVAARLDISPVRDLDARLPFVPQLPPLKAIRAELKELAQEAFVA